MRTLFVRATDDGFIDIPQIQALFNYYHQTNGFSKKLILQVQLGNLKVEYKLGTDWVDFGIYGDHLIFKTQHYTTDGPTTGLFCHDQNEVSKFVRFFDKAWEDAQEIVPKEEKRVTLKDVFPTSG